MYHSKKVMALAIVAELDDQHAGDNEERRLSRVASICEEVVNGFNKAAAVLSLEQLAEKNSDDDRPSAVYEKAKDISVMLPILWERVWKDPG
jgi:hypothetical protein